MTEHPERKNIKGMSLNELKLLMSEFGEKSFHARQIYQWMYQKGVRSFKEMTNLSQNLCKQLAESLELSALTLKTTEVSSADQTIKFLFELSDHQYVESVYMTEEKRITVCLSTMVGCPMGCPYCATGQMGHQCNLTAGEIVDQLLMIQSNTGKLASNVVFMGMGEPFLNYENVIKAADLLKSELGSGIAAKKITVSTCGIVPAIYRFADEGHRFKLAVSLNASNDEKRDQLIPVNRKYPLKELFKAILYYTRKSKRRVTFEYVLIQEFNDTPEDARRLVNLLSPIPCKLNLIPFNETECVEYRRPTEQAIDRFVSEVYRAPFTVTVRRSKGVDISAACGQLYVRNQMA